MQDIKHFCSMVSKTKRKMELINNIKQNRMAALCWRCVVWKLKEFDMEQGTYTDDRNMVEYLVSGPMVFVRMRNRDNTWTNYEEALHGMNQLQQHVDKGYLTKR